MSEWAVRKKTFYLSGFFGFLALAVLTVVVLSLMGRPGASCFDGIQNQGEWGVDCGGPCAAVCSFEVSPLEVDWARAFEVVPGQYNLVAYITNPNDFFVDSAKYVFETQDAQGRIVSETEGVAFIPPNQTFIVFEDRVFTDDQQISRTFFEFAENMEWVRLPENYNRPDVSVSEKFIVGTDSEPRMRARVRNNALRPIENVDIYTLIIDARGNALQASRTFREIIPRESESLITNTWPRPFVLQKEACLQPVDVVLAFDRSGSMAFDNLDLTEPEPMTTARRAAVAFVEKLQSEDDRIGLVSFATEATEDLPLSADSNRVKQAIRSINIQAETISEIYGEHTNIGDALFLALKEIESNNFANSSDKAVVLFTDGVPTRPIGDYLDFPRDHAIKMANDLKSLGVYVYTIGLGEAQQDIEFLQSVATTPDHYYGTPSPDELAEIYQEIALSICERGPARIDVIPIVKDVFVSQQIKD